MSSEPKADILMVDDRPENLTALEAMLADLGQNLVKAHSGEEALKCLLQQDSQRFAVILLDVQMPGMDGLEAAEIIRGRESLRSTPIIFITAFSRDDEQVSRGYTLGGVDFIFKPVVPEILLAKVSVFVELFKRTEQVRQQAERLHELEEEERRERELLSLARLAGQGNTAVTAQIYGGAPLRESVPDTFAETVERYGELLDLALEQRACKVDHGTSDKLRSMAQGIAFLKGGPRDVVEIHTTALKEKCRDTVEAKARAYAEEGRLMVLELMGCLAAVYRRNAPAPSFEGRRKAPASSDEQASRKGERP